MSVLIKKGKRGAFSGDKRGRVFSVDAFSVVDRTGVERGILREKEIFKTYRDGARNKILRRKRAKYFWRGPKAHYRNAIYIFMSPKKEWPRGGGQIFSKGAIAPPGPPWRRPCTTNF